MGSKMYVVHRGCKVHKNTDSRSGDEMTLFWTSKRKYVCLVETLLFPTLLNGLISCKNGEAQPTEVQNKSKTYNHITYHKLIVAPYYNEEEDHPDAYFKGMRAMATDGSTLFISSVVYPIVQMRDGQFQGLLGNAGQGPGEYNLPVLALASNANKTLVLTQKNMLWYHDGHFIEDFLYPGNLRALWPLRRGLGANSFDFNDELIVLPVGLTARPGDIGSVLDYSGELVHIINDPEFTEANLHLSPLSQKTLWQHHEDKWLCLPVYR